MNKIRKIIAFICAVLVICLTFAVPCFAYGGYSASSDLAPSPLYVPWIPWNLAIKKSAFDSYWCFPNVLECTGDFAGGATVGYPDGLATWRYDSNIGISTPILDVQPYAWYNQPGYDNITCDLYACDVVLAGVNRYYGKSFTYYFTTKNDFILPEPVFGLCLTLYAVIPLGDSYTVTARIPLDVTNRPFGTNRDYSISVPYGSIRQAVANISAVREYYEDGAPIYVSKMCLVPSVSLQSSPSSYSVDIGENIYHPSGKSILACSIDSMVEISEYNLIYSTFRSNEAFNDGWFQGYTSGYDVGFEEGRSDPMSKVDFGKPISNAITSMLQTKIFDIPFNDNSVPLTLGGIILIVVTIAFIPIVVKLFSN